MGKVFADIRVASEYNRDFVFGDETRFVVLEVEVRRTREWSDLIEIDSQGVFRLKRIGWRLWLENRDCAQRWRSMKGDCGARRGMTNAGQTCDMN